MVRLQLLLLLLAELLLLPLLTMLLMKPQLRRLPLVQLLQVERLPYEVLCVALNPSRFLYIQPPNINKLLFQQLFYCRRSCC
jgi:hypothetical protein